MHSPPIDEGFILEQLQELLAIPSPTGYTDGVVRHTSKVLQGMGLDVELTRRGAIRTCIKGKVASPDRAIVVHLDTLGAMVRGLGHNGRLQLAPIGTWSARFASGARVTVFTDASDAFRGTILPLKASGHVYNEEIDTQEVSWDHIELRLDEPCRTAGDLQERGIAVGDFIAIDPQPEFNPNGYINSRHLDNKAGAAAVLAAAKAALEAGLELPTDVHLLFTISEEVGSGASHVLHKDAAEMVAVDNATPAPGQNSIERGVTLAMMDSTGPFDFHLTRHLVGLCKEHGIRFARDVFRYYRCDVASAIEAGNDIRTALVCFGCDSSHGWERSHMDSLSGVARLLTLYMQSQPVCARDREELAPLRGFPDVQASTGGPEVLEEEPSE